MIAAGIWARHARRRLTVVILRPDGSRPPSLRVARTDAARDALVHYLLGFGGQVQLAVPDSVAEQDGLPELLRGHPICAWLVPDPLLDAIAAAAGLGPAAARSRAAILARLPAVPTFRPLLRRIPPPDPRQLTLVR